MKKQTNHDKDTELLKDGLNSIYDSLRQSHKLTSLLDKYCKFHINNDDFYEISYIAELLEQKLNQLTHDYYLLLNNNKINTIDEILENIKTLKDSGQLEFVD